MVHDPKPPKTFKLAAPTVSPERQQRIRAAIASIRHEREARSRAEVVRHREAALRGVMELDDRVRILTTKAEELARRRHALYRLLKTVLHAPKSPAPEESSANGS
eukprot:m51a1_g114 hypothetical protein (105) ;mRNA; r:350509-350917